MKRMLWFTLIAALALAAPSGYDLFQKALVKERAEGNVEEAIQLYQRIVKEFAADRTLVAKALVQIGQCYEKLGKDEARKAYQRVLREFADQPDPVTTARARLAVLEQPKPAAKTMATRQVWAGPDVDPLGSVSPDGRYASLVDWDTGDLAVKDLVNGEKRRLTNKGTWLDSDEFALYSRFSPDGKQIAYSWLNKDNRFDLRVVALADGSKPRVLYANEEIEYLQPADWSRDGRQMAVILTRDRTNQLAMVSVTDGSARVIKTLDWRYPDCVSLSPDGRYLAYDFPEREDAVERDINLLAVDGSREIPLVEHPARDQCPIWMPDGKRILFGSDRTGMMSGWLIPVADGKPAGAPQLVIRHELGPKSMPMGVTPGGSLYYAFLPSARDVFVATVDLETGKTLSAPAPASRRYVGFNRSPEWSPDGRYLVFQSRPPSRPDLAGLTIRSMESGEERELHLRLRYLNRPRWSPDGRYLVGRGNDLKGRGGLYRVDVQSGEVAPLVVSSAGENAGQAEWSADGKALFFIRSIFRENLSRIVVRDLESGQEREIFQTTGVGPTINHLTVSRDASQIAFIKYERATPSVMLMVVPAAGGQARVLHKEVPGKQGPRGGLAWTPDGRSLLLVREPPRERKAELWLIPFGGGEPRKLEAPPEGLLQMRIHPDGRRIAFQAGEDRAELWVMENFLPALRAAR